MEPEKQMEKVGLGELSLEDVKYLRDSGFEGSGFIYFDGGHYADGELKRKFEHPLLGSLECIIANKRIMVRNELGLLINLFYGRYTLEDVINFCEGERNGTRNKL